jgi:two-component system NarL family response regulator
MEAQPIRVIVADDHALFRQGLRSLLRTQSDIAFVAEADSFSTLARVFDSDPCDVVLLDLRMEQSPLGEITKLSKRAKVVVVTASERIDECVAAVRAGASGVVFKRFAVESLMDAIRAVVTGGAWMPPSVQSALANRLRHDPAPLLTPREHEIVRHVGLGMRNADIAARLFISERTVKTHLNNIFGKLGVRDRTELALLALKTGIVDMPE